MRSINCRHATTTNLQHAYNPYRDDFPSDLPGIEEQAEGSTRLRPKSGGRSCPNDIVERRPRGASGQSVCHG